jgi:hypothetical protein
MSRSTQVTHTPSFELTACSGTATARDDSEAQRWPDEAAAFSSEAMTW